MTETPAVNVVPPTPAAKQRLKSVSSFAENQASPLTTEQVDELLGNARRAYIAGQRGQALDMAMRLTGRVKRRDAGMVWHFVGAAACSQRLAPEATRALKQLKDPNVRSMLIALCRRNGLKLAENVFVPTALAD